MYTLTKRIGGFKILIDELVIGKLDFGRVLCMCVMSFRS